MIALGVFINTQKTDVLSGGSVFATSFVTLVPEPPITLRHTLVFPIFPNDIPSNSETLSCESKLARLAQEDPAADAGVKEVGCGLRSCAAPGHEVIVDIQGFASSREFTCIEQSSNVKISSNEMNLTLAQRRRERIRDLLVGRLTDVSHCDGLGAHLDQDHPITIKPDINSPRWSGSTKEEQMKAMEVERGLRDRDNAGSPLRGKEILTRRVDVVLVNAGTCKDDQRPPDQAQ